MTNTLPTRTIVHLLALGSLWACFGSAGVGVGSAGVGVGSAGVGVGSAGVGVGDFGYQRVGMGNANGSHWGLYPTQSPNKSGFALHWNIGFTNAQRS